MSKTMSAVEYALQTFIDDVRGNDYYAEYECLIELDTKDLIPLPFKPSELEQAYIKVCA